MGDIVKRSADGATRFYVRYVDVDGKRKQRKAPSPIGAARKFLAAVETRIANGKVGIEEPTPAARTRATVTIAELSERFLKEHRPQKIKSFKEWEMQGRSVFLVRINPALGRRAASTVTTVDVEAFSAAQAAEGYATGSIESNLRWLSTLFEWANKVGALDCRNPVKGAQRPSRNPSIDYLDAVEVGRLLAYAEEHALDVFPMIATAIYTGLRKGELFGLRWRDLDVAGRRLTVARSYSLAPKSNKSRHLRMHPELQRILRGWRDRCPPSSEGLVFPVEARGKWRMGKRDEQLGIDDERDEAGEVVTLGILSRAGCHVPAKPWHGLRHTFASHFMMSGGNILTLQKLLGHSDLKQTLVYAHLSPDFMDAEICRLNFAAPSSAGVASLDEERRKRSAPAEGAQ